MMIDKLCRKGWSSGSHRTEQNVLYEHHISNYLHFYAW